jgi:hypothetical protein
VKEVHGCEAQTVMERMKSSLKTWEQKILRKICGPIRDQNDEMQVRCRK